MNFKVRDPEDLPEWLEERHKKFHKRLRISNYHKIEGCEECVLELIWEKSANQVKMICKLHFLEHRNLGTSYYHVSGNSFNACSMCIDNVIFLLGDLVYEEIKAS